MDLGITGIIDILIIVCGLLVMLIGYLRGFMNKALTIVGLVLMFVVAILFCGQLAGFFKSTGFIYNDLVVLIFIGHSFFHGLSCFSSCVAHL